MEAKEHLTVDDCLKLYEEEGIVGLVEKVKAISFKAGQEGEYKKWVKAFMSAGILIAEADTVCIAVEETRRAGIREVVEWVEKYKSCDITQVTFNRTSVEQCVLIKVVDWQAKLKEWGL